MNLSTCTPGQRQSIEHVRGPLLVSAGAGSGKTRVLTYRIANILEQDLAAPWEILAITFTNKAAAEMRERLNGLVGPRCRGMWVSTFHSMCVRMLRADAERLGFTKNFTIYDTDDLKRLYKDIMAELNIDPKRFPVNQLMNRISQAKNDLVTPGNFDAHDPVGKVAERVYERLQERLRAANAFDFDDLLLYGYLLLKNHADVREAYQDRFRYLMVDEYQDTNRAQYAITQLLAAKRRNIMVVGDDDQSIYSWRGADLRNILEFESDYPEAKVVKLEQNYRSVGNVLAAANAVIANNQHRKEKRLFTDSGDGEKISVYLATDERDEGRWIAGEIDRRRSEGTSYNNMAVFYRTNAQSRMLEDMLLRAGVPYRIVGGTRFFDRAEIRDVMAYLTLVVNPADDIAAKRVVNVPRRGIGKTTIERIDQYGREMNMPFLTAAELAVVDPDIRASTRNAVGEFIQVIKDGATYGGDLRKVVEMIIDKAGLIRALQDEGTDEARGRVENIQEFLGVVDEFVQTHDAEESDFAAPTVGEDESAEPVRVLRGDSLADFIEWVRLRTDLDTVTEDGQAVTLMTVHSSKGLEFDCVWVAGMEETLFPHMNSVGDAAAVEEERRLAYVAITRARKRLCLTCAQQRQIFGQTHANPVSRFIGEIPSELRQTSGLGSAGFSGTGWEKRGDRRGTFGSGRGSDMYGGRVFGSYTRSTPGTQRRTAISPDAGRVGTAGSDRGAASRKPATFGSGAPRPKKSAVSATVERKVDVEAAAATFVAGDRVSHKTFGPGTVISAAGDMIEVQFERSGQTKKLMKGFAPIVKLV